MVVKERERRKINGYKQKNIYMQKGKTFASPLLHRAEWQHNMKERSQIVMLLFTLITEIKVNISSRQASHLAVKHKIHSAIFLQLQK